MLLSAQKRCGESPELNLECEYFVVCLKLSVEEEKGAIAPGRKAAMSIGLGASSLALRRRRPFPLSYTCILLPLLCRLSFMSIRHTSLLSVLFRLVRCCLVSPPSGCDGGWECVAAVMMMGFFFTCTKKMKKQWVCRKANQRGWSPRKQRERKVSIPCFVCVCFFPREVSQCELPWSFYSDSISVRAVVVVVVV